MLAKNKKNFAGLIKPVVTVMAKTGLRPNHLTVLGLALGIIAFLFTSIDYWITLALFALAFSLDAFDGALARTTGNVSKFGGFLDSVCDKIVEVLFIASIALRTGLFTIALFAVSLSILISYSKHRAQCLGAKFIHSSFDRAERLIYSLVMMLVHQFNQLYTQYLFIIYTVLCATAILQVFYRVKKQL